MTRWSVDRINDRAFRLLDANGLHVGNLKCIGGVWTFKAIGYEASGAVIPGGGAFTDRHNTVFSTLDVAHISSTLGGALDAGSTLGDHPVPSQERRSAAGTHPAD